MRYAAMLKAFVELGMIAMIPRRNARGSGVDVTAVAAAARSRDWCGRERTFGCVTYPVRAANLITLVEAAAAVQNT
jgi:hypothetical protein